MKLDSGPAYRNSPLIHEPASKSIEYVDNPFENGIFKADNDFGREGKHEIPIPSVIEIENYATDTNTDGDALEDILGPRSYSAVEDTIDVAANGVENMVATYSNPFETSYTNPFEDDTYFYADKAVTEIELPELIACLKDSNYHDVAKDICIDMGVPPLDKIVEENDEVGQKRVNGYPHSDFNENGDFTKEVMGHTEPVTDGMDPLVFSGQPTCGAKKVDNHLSAESFLKEGRDNVHATYGIANDAAEEKAVPEKLASIGNDKDKDLSDGLKSLVFDGKNFEILLKDGGDIDSMDHTGNDFSNGKLIPEKSHSVHELNRGNSDPDSSSFTGNEDRRLSDQGVRNAMDDVDARLQGASEGATSDVASATQLSNNTKNAMNFLFDRTVESGSITFNFNSSSPVTSRRMVSPESSDYQESGWKSNVPGLEDGSLDSLTGSSRSFFIQHGLGESNYVSGPIAYLGQIPYSGSTSLRSDSSTTSTRSFAFPVLQTEWSGSPVKMAKPDRRQLRKHRGWRAWIPCCRC